MQSYADLHALIKKQIAYGMVICDRNRKTPEDELNQWRKVSWECLILVQDLGPRLAGDLDRLNLYVSMPEEDIETEVVEDGNRMALVHKVDETLWSQSWFRDDGDNPTDLNFSAIKRAVELLELADRKLRLEFERDAAPVASPKLPAEQPGADNTQEMAANKSMIDANLTSS